VLQAQSGFTCIISQIPFSNISSLSLPLLVSQVPHHLILVIGADSHTQPWLSHRAPIPEIPTERYQQPANKTMTESKESPDATRPDQPQHPTPETQTREETPQPTFPTPHPNHPAKHNRHPAVSNRIAINHHHHTKPLPLTLHKPPPNRPHH
jgi:hypothetical protein